MYSPVFSQGRAVWCCGGARGNVSVLCALPHWGRIRQSPRYWRTGSRHETSTMGISPLSSLLPLLLAPTLFSIPPSLIPSTRFLPLSCSSLLFPLSFPSPPLFPIFHPSCYSHRLLPVFPNTPVPSFPHMSPGRCCRASVPPLAWHFSSTVPSCEWKGLLLPSPPSRDWAPCSCKCLLSS